MGAHLCVAESEEYAPIARRIPKSEIRDIRKTLEKLNSTDSVAEELEYSDDESFDQIIKEAPKKRAPEQVRQPSLEQIGEKGGEKIPATPKNKAPKAFDKIHVLGQKGSYVIDYAAGVVVAYGHKEKRATLDSIDFTQSSESESEDSDTETECSDGPVEFEQFDTLEYYESRPTTRSPTPITSVDQVDEIIKDAYKMINELDEAEMSLDESDGEYESEDLHMNETNSTHVGVLFDGIEEVDEESESLLIEPDIITERKYSDDEKANEIGPVQLLEVNPELSDSDLSTMEEAYTEPEVRMDHLNMGPDLSEDIPRTRQRGETRRLSRQEADQLRRTIRSKRKKRKRESKQGSSMSEELFEAEDVRYSNLRFSDEKVSALWKDEYFVDQNIDFRDPTCLDGCDLSPSGQAFVKDFISKSIRSHDAMTIYQAMWLSEHRNTPLVDFLSAPLPIDKSYCTTGWAGYFLLWKESKFVFVDFVLHQFCKPNIPDKELCSIVDIMDPHFLQLLFSSLFSRGIPIRTLGPYFFSKGVSVDAECIYLSRGAPTPGTLLHALSASSELEEEHLEACGDCLIKATSGASAFDEFVLNWESSHKDFDIFYLLFLQYGHDLHISEYDTRLVARAKRREVASNRTTKRMLNKHGIAQMKIFVLIFSYTNCHWELKLNGLSP